jgi:hypothetical protein
MSTYRTMKLGGARARGLGGGRAVDARRDGGLLQRGWTLSLKRPRRHETGVWQGRRCVAAHMAMAAEDRDPYSRLPPQRSQAPESPGSMKQAAQASRLTCS